MPESDPLEAFPVVITLPVQWGDQDAIGHVNNVVPLRWFESARIAYFERLGLPTVSRGSTTSFILASNRCDYRRQITYPDSVRVGTRVLKIGNTSLTFETVIVSEAQSAVAVEGESVVVMFDYEAQAKERIHDELRSAIAALQPGQL